MIVLRFRTRREMDIVPPIGCATKALESNQSKLDLNNIALIQTTDTKRRYLFQTSGNNTLVSDNYPDRKTYKGSFESLKIKNKTPIK